MPDFKILDLLRDRILVLDGAMGTFLQSHVRPGACMELINLEEPELASRAHCQYLAAGADILSTNTFGASAINLRSFGLGPRTREINVRAAQLARAAAGGKALVAGTIGPTGKLVDPLGPLSFEEAYEAFRVQAEALAEGGADCILLETFSDLREIKAALLAACEHTRLPVLASMTFEKDFLTFTGTDPETAATVLEASGADAIGVNCSTGPEPMLEVLGRYSQTTGLPLFAEPNAGMPKLENGVTCFSVSPEEMARFALQFADIGASFIGSCCGSTPEHTRRLKQALAGRKPVSRASVSSFRLSSRVRSVSIGPGKPFCVIGERINPTNRNDLSGALANHDFGPIQEEAIRQVREGANVLDVNVGVPGIDESSALAGVVRLLSSTVQAPLCIDSTRSEAVEAALREIPGKPLINSVNGDSKSLNSILPLARRYGAAVLCLAVGERGIPDSAEERIAVLRSIIAEASRLGIPKSNLICDCLTLTVSAGQSRAEETLKAVRIVREELKLPTVLGVSNVSFGLPDRSLINAAFLSMAMSSGLDAAILNPGDARMMETARAASVLTLRDRDSRDFVLSHSRRRRGPDAVASHTALSADSARKVYDAVLHGNRDGVGVLVQHALDEGRSATEINETALIPAIREVGRLYERKEVYLPQMILSAETLQKAFKILEPRFGGAGVKHSGTVVLCTVKGDVHDIGKNLVGLFLRNHGFRVVDLGKDVPAEAVVDDAVKHDADAVALSALMTTTMTEMPTVIRALRDAGSRAKVLVGGAVVTQAYAEAIGADGYTKDGATAADLLHKLMRRK
jgi:5-methyltetrahydrofolate--homocysteine methyltransferase